MTHSTLPYADSDQLSQLYHVACVAHHAWITASPRAAYAARWKLRWEYQQASAALAKAVRELRRNNTCLTGMTN